MFPTIDSHHKVEGVENLRGEKKAFQSAWIRHQKQLYNKKPSSSSSCAHFVFCHGPHKMWAFEIGLHPALCKTESKTLCEEDKLQCNFTRLQEVYTSFCCFLTHATTTTTTLSHPRCWCMTLNNHPMTFCGVHPSKFLFDDPQGRINSH